MRKPWVESEGFLQARFIHGGKVLHIFAPGSAPYVSDPLCRRRAQAYPLRPLTNPHETAYGYRYCARCVAVWERTPEQ